MSKNCLGVSAMNMPNLHTAKNLEKEFSDHLRGLPQEGILVGFELIYEKYKIATHFG